MNKYKILAVAPYEAMRDVLLQVSKEYPALEVVVEVGAIHEGVKKLAKHNLQEFDAILSRGGTKIEIEKHTALPVFEIPISYFDLLNIIKLLEHYQGKIAILTYANIAKAAKTLCELLNFPYNIFTINEWHNAKEKVMQLKESGYTLIIGDAVSVIHAEKLGIQSILLTSSAASIREAFYHIQKFCSYAYPFTLSVYLQHSYHKVQNESVLCFDYRGKLLWNEGIPRHTQIESYCYHLIPSLKKEHQLLTQKQWQNNLFEIHGNCFLHRDQLYYFFHVKQFLAGNRKEKSPSYLFRRESPIPQSQSLPNSLQLLAPSAWKRALQLITGKLNFCLIGESGVDGENIAHQIYLKIGNPSTPFYVISPLIMENTDIKRLCTAPHSPLFLPHAIFCIKDLLQLSKTTFQYLIDELRITAYETTAKFFFIFEGNDNQKELDLRHQYVLDRFQTHTIILPVLRNKKDQIFNYTLLYIQFYNHRNDAHIAGIEPEAIALLNQYTWPENLKQLQRILQKALLSTDTPWINARSIRLALKEEHQTTCQFSSSQIDISQPLHQIIRQIATKVMQKENNNQTKVAKRLGISRTTLWRILKEK